MKIEIQVKRGIKKLYELVYDITNKEILTYCGGGARVFYMVYSKLTTHYPDVKTCDGS